MSATDELRRLLDERGVEWETNETLADCWTRWNVGNLRCTATEINGRFAFTVGGCTPEQAIAATLGGDGKTRWHELFGTPEKAARTLAGIACEDGVCEGCSLYGAHCTYDGTAQLEWLRGDA